MGDIENEASNNSSVVACVSRYCGNVYTEPLPSKDRRIFTEPLLSNDMGIHIQTNKLMGGIFFN
jgi:hypothetical protein